MASPRGLALLLACCALAARPAAAAANGACADDGGVSPIYGPSTAPPLLNQSYFAGAGEYQKLNLYPTSASDGAGAPKVPLAIFVHGGGWKSGSRYKIDERWDSLDLRYFGFAVASMGYRLSQAAPWPAQINDLKAGVQWLYDHADDHGLDRDRFFVYGQSAGGHLALMLGLNHNEGGMLKATVDFYGPVGLSMNTDDSMDSSINQLLGCPAPDCPEQARDADPIVHLDGGDPPLLIIHGTGDTKVPITASEGLYNLSSAAGIDVAMMSTDGAGHAMSGCLSPNKAWGFMPADSPAAAAVDQTRAMLRWLNGRGLVLCGDDGAPPPPPGAAPPAAAPPPPPGGVAACLNAHCAQALAACQGDAECTALMQSGSITRTAVQANAGAYALVECGCQPGACPAQFGGLCGMFDEGTTSTTTAASSTSTTTAAATSTTTVSTTTAAATTAAATSTTTASSTTMAASATTEARPLPDTTATPTAASGASVPILCSAVLLFLASMQ